MDQAILLGANRDTYASYGAMVSLKEGTVTLYAIVTIAPFPFPFSFSFLFSFLSMSCNVPHRTLHNASFTFDPFFVLWFSILFHIAYIVVTCRIRGTSAQIVTMRQMTISHLTIHHMTDY